MNLISSAQEESSFHRSFADVLVLADIVIGGERP